MGDTKWAVQVHKAEQAPWIFREAFRIARSGRPGPVLIDLHHKDMGIAIDAARQADVALPVTGLVAQLMAAARASGYGSLDHSALLRVVESLSGKGKG